MTTTKSPSLELISESGEAHSTEKRRRPRINLTSEQFRMSRGGKIFSVVDLSAEGMAFRILDSSDLLALPIGTLVEGTLNLRGEKFSVQARVRHLGPHIVGCQFENRSKEVVTALERLLDPAELGRELRPIPSSDQGVLWYHGPSGTDLLLARGTDGRYRRLTLFVLGSFVQWDEEKGLLTGRAKSSEERMDQHPQEWGVVQFEMMLLEPDAAADADKLSIAKALILSSNLPQDLKKWCARQLALGV